MPIKIVAISDTHNKHQNIKIPKCDILIHAGDLSMVGSWIELNAFNNWLGTLQAKHIVLVPGNHDWLFAENEREARSIVDKANILIEESITLEGLKIYGFPHQPRFGDWAFNVDRDSPEMQRIVNRIPVDTDILVTHGPPAAVLDYIPRSKENVGCRLLANAVNNRERLPNLTHHIFGHIHEGAGQEIKNGVRYINAAQLDERYQVAQTPIEINLG